MAIALDTAEADVGSLVEQRVEAGPQVVTLAGYTEPQHSVEGCRAGIQFLVGDATVGESLGEGGAGMGIGDGRPHQVGCTQGQAEDVEFPAA